MFRILLPSWRHCLCLCGLWLVLGFQVAQAQTCTSAGTVSTYTFPAPTAPIAVTGNEAGGAILWRSGGIAPDQGFYINCTGPVGDGLIHRDGLNVAYGQTTMNAGYYTLPSNVPGIGYVIWYNGASLPTYPQRRDSATPNNAGGIARAELLIVRMKPVTAGSQAIAFGTSPFASWIFGDNQVVGARFRVGGTGSVPLNIARTTTTCTVTTGSANQAIQLRPVTVNNIDDVSIAGAIPVNIDLNCAAGANPYITFTDANNIANRSDRLTAQPAERNVALRLARTDGGGNVFYGPDSDWLGNQNQFAASPTTANQGPLRLSFQASYVRAAANLVPTPGPITARATFTMSYR